MEFSYGQGIYLEDKKRIEGQIILSEHKLFLKGTQGDLTATYIPLEKIEGIKRASNKVLIYVRPSLAYRYTAVIEGGKKQVTELANDLVQRRGLKKKFLKNEWIEVNQ